MLRYSDIDPASPTIDAHASIIASIGFAWLGKFGMGVSRAFVARGMSQISAGRATYLYLHTNKRVTHRARVIALEGCGADARLLTPDREATPAYYRERSCSVWFKIVELQPCEVKWIQDLRLYDDPSLKPTFRSMRGLFYVTEFAR